MTTDRIPHLRVVRSVGRPKPMLATDPDGRQVIYERKSRPCGGCQQVTAEADTIVKYRRTWWHKECADRDIDAGNPEAAWTSLAHDLARSPRSYNVGETRAIVGWLLGRLDRAGVDDEFSPAIGGAQ